MDKERRFKKGDKVTYKNRKDCFDSKGKDDRYYYGGSDHGGIVGEIIHYTHTYVKEKQCWKITVSSQITNGSYSMLECEFEEYDAAPTSNELFPLY